MEEKSQENVSILPREIKDIASLEQGPDTHATGLVDAGWCTPQRQLNHPGEEEDLVVETARAHLRGGETAGHEPAAASALAARSLFPFSLPAAP